MKLDIHTPIEPKSEYTRSFENEASANEQNINNKIAIITAKIDVTTVAQILQVLVVSLC